jgi:2-(1,2-epoxy-1,2-dihydrophenyl)acetyl-CoA isomerase
MSTRIDFSVKDRIAKIVLNAPERRNAIDLEFLQAWLDCTEACAAAQDLQLIQIEARGDIFSVGGDIAAFVANADDPDPYIPRCIKLFHDGIDILQKVDAPILLALQGAAGGGAFSLVCGADIVIASSKAKLASGYTKIGLTPDGGLTFFLTKLVGQRRAFEIIALNRPISADEAKTLGLVTQVVEPAELDEAVAIAAQELASAPDRVLGEVKRLLVNAHHASLREQLDLEGEIMGGRAALEDSRARQRAFFEKSRK